MLELQDAALARLVVERAEGAGGARERQAEAEAEAELCRRFAPRVRLYGLKHLRDEDKARDLVQAVLVSVIEALRAGRVEDCDRIDRFMLGTARNLAMRMKHQDGRAMPMGPDDINDLTQAVAAVTMTEMNAAPLDFEALLQCMALLEARAQTVLHLSFYREKEAHEIASVMETSAGNVRVLRHRAIAQLRDCLASKEVVA